MPPGGADHPRELIKINPVEGQVVERHASAYVSIKSFHSHGRSAEHAPTLLAEPATARRRWERCRGLILDLRGNPGGYLNQAVAVADTFLDRGQIVSTVDGNGRKQDVEEARPSKSTEPDYPIVVLVNSNSASASEIVGGALRNNERAVIVGERTFGKGSVQNLHQFFDDSKLKLTISKYLTPGDKSIQAVGIPADVELVPVVVEEQEDGERLVRMYWRERVRREADLDKSLTRSTQRDDETAYSLHYLQSERSDGSRHGLDPNDYQVRFARDLILGAGSSRRAEMLANAAQVVDTHARKGNASVEKAMSDVGIDWSNGPGWSGEGIPVEVVLDLGDDGAIRAGERDEVTLLVTNTSDRPLYRVGAVARDNEVLEGREFIFGRLEPQQSRRYSIPVSLVDGYPAEHSPVTIEVRDADAAIGSVTADVVITARELPELEWSWRVDDSRGGDGDGIVEVGETLDIDVEVKNVGTGLTGQSFARIKNRNGAALDILAGTLELGTLKTLSGKACDAVSKQSGCQIRLAPGEVFTGRFEVELKERRAEGYDLELTLGDGEAYDHGSIVRAGFYEYFSQSETLHLEPGQPLPGVETRRRPRIEISRAPELVADADRVSLSGLVSDDTGIRHVMVYGAEDKLFYQGGGEVAVRSVPFTADVPLQDGANVLTVIAQDDQGLTSTRSVVTYKRPPQAVSIVTPPE